MNWWSFEVGVEVQSLAVQMINRPFWLVKNFCQRYRESARKKQKVK